MWMISSLVSFLFPPQCLGCRKNGVSLCDRCIQLVRKSLTAPHSYIVSAFDFKDPLIKRAIHAVKYYHRRDLVPPLSLVLADELKKIPLENTVLIPVPMHPLRKLLRGYNQAELIARELAKMLELPVDTSLVTKIKNGKRQATIKHRKERLKNQHGAFALKGDAQSGTYLLIDDVTTTGATLEELRSLLIQHGAKTVRAATLAH